MLLKCPNCPARYEAPDEAFGPEGRVVECSACGERWLQPGPQTAAAPPADAEPRPEMPGLAEAAAAMAALRDPEGGEADAPAEPDLSAGLRARPDSEAPAGQAAGSDALTGEILDDRAPLTAAADPGDLSGAPADQPDDGDDDDDDDGDRAQEDGASATVTHLSAAGGEKDAGVRIPGAVNWNETDDSGAVRLPDAERLNADLRGDAFVEPAAPSRGGFWTGVILALVISGAAAGVYLQRGRIAEAVPAAAPALESYGRYVDTARVEIGILAEDAQAVGGEFYDKARLLVSDLLDPAINDPDAAQGN